MLPKETSVGSLLLALVVTGIALSGGFESYKAMKDKAEAQTTAVAEFQQWKEQYTQLLPVEQRWSRELQGMSQVKDLYSLYALLGDKPKVNPDTLLVDRIERLKENSVDLGAQRVCVSTGNSGGVDFYDTSFDGLMSGLNTLIARPDVEVGAITFSYDSGKAKASVRDLCLLLRDPEGGKK